MLCVVLALWGVDGAPIAKIHLLKDYQSTLGAACIDGTPPAYYIVPGTGSGADKWFIFHQGGGWCTSLADCYARSKTALGSSSGYPQTLDLADEGGYFSDDPTANPAFYNWNKVYFPYCDGGSFSGNNQTLSDYQGHSLMFRGYRNLQAYWIDLALKFDLQLGKEFVVSGCSAGGLATYLHVDWWAGKLPQGSKVVGVPDSGYFLDYDSKNGPKYSTDMKWVFSIMNSTEGVNRNCIKANTQQPALCFFAEHTVPHITTPLFPLQSRYDSWQTANILGSSNAADINAYGKLFDERFQALLNRNQNGAFLDSCFHHCGAFDSIRIDGLLSGPAIQKFVTTGQGVHIQVNTYPCEPCCKPN
uniref:Pectin acetylesterase n=1 Tax=Arcella intermedia TaxID=1963864 RepID=A0A6B2L7Z4_9EUKA